ncbi:MAG: phosphate acyltransferase [Planctomycetota bacterium]
MDPIRQLIEEAKKHPARIVFPEGADEIMVRGATQAARLGICKPVFVGSSAGLAPSFQRADASLDEVDLLDIASFPSFKTYVSACAEMRQVKEAIARRLMLRPLYFGSMMVRLGDADGLVAGVATITSAVAKAAKLVIGVREGLSVPSSFFIMVFENSPYGEHGSFLFADAGFNPNPNKEELAQIAVTTARSAQDLLGWTPRVAMLSFSTKESAVHEMTLRVMEATAIAHELAPEIAIDGELQVDAAIDPRVAKRKLSESPVAGRANVLIFPDLNAGNIAYKIAQYLGGAKAYGPIFQGFNRPINDLSRGAGVDDVVGVTAVTVVQARKGKSD